MITEEQSAQTTRFGVQCAGASSTTLRDTARIEALGKAKTDARAVIRRDICQSIDDESGAESAAKQYGLKLVRHNKDRRNFYYGFKLAGREVMTWRPGTQRICIAGCDSGRSAETLIDAVHVGGGLIASAESTCKKPTPNSGSTRKSKCRNRTCAKIQKCTRDVDVADGARIHRFAPTRTLTAAETTRMIQALARSTDEEDRALADSLIDEFSNGVKVIATGEGLYREERRAA